MSSAANWPRPSVVCGSLATAASLLLVIMVVSPSLCNSWFVRGVTTSGAVLHTLSGICILLYARESVRLGLLFAAFTFLLTLLSLMQYIPQLDLQIDQEVAAATLGMCSAHFQRTPPNLAVTIFTLSTAFVLWPTTLRHPDRLFLAAFITLIGMSIAVITLYGHVIDAETAFGWGQYTSASPHSASLSLLVGLGFLFLVWEEVAIDQARFKRLWRSMMLFSVSWVLLMSLLSAAIGIWPLAERLSEIQLGTASVTYALSSHISQVVIASTLIALFGSSVLFLFLRIFYKHFLRLQGMIVSSASKLSAELEARTKSEMRLAAALLEKETLIQEVHHRVNNNLQVIASMVRMQLRRTPSEATKDQLSDTYRRVQSLSLLHQLIYRSDRLSEISAQDYFKEIGESVVAIDESGRNFPISVSAEDLYLSPDQALPCGLIVSELIANSVQHGFPQDGNGNGNVTSKPTIYVKADVNGESISLVVGDNGVGFETPVSQENPRTLGMRLVNMMAAQLDGSISWEGSGGTVCKISFNREHSADE